MFASVTRSIALGSMVMLLASVAVAQTFDEAKPQWQLRGFGSLGVARSDSYDLGFQNDLKQSKMIRGGRFEARVDSVIGAQLNAQLHSAVELVVQLVLKERRDTSIDDIVHFAYLSIDATPNLGFRVGRNQHDIYFISDSRDVSYSYLWVRPVSEFYDQHFVDYYDGADVSYTYPTKEGVLTARAMGGVMDVLLGVEGPDGNVEYSYTPFFGAKLAYERDDFEIHLGFQQAKVNNPPEILKLFSDAWGAVPASTVATAPNIQRAFDLDNTHARSISAGISWQPGNWLIQSELSRFTMPDVMDLRTRAGYLSVGYQMGQWTPYVVSAHLRDTIDPVGYRWNEIQNLPSQVQPLATITRGVYSSLGPNQRTFSLGARWDFHPKMALKLQWDKVKVNPDGQQMWVELSERARFGEDLNMYTVVLDFII